MKSVLSAVALAALVPLGGCVIVDSQGHITREEKRFTVTAAPDLRLTTSDGAIEIRSGEAQTVTVEIERRGPSQEAIDQLKVETKQDGNRIDVEVKRPAHDFIFLGLGHITPTAKLIVTMPGEGNVIARSGDGAIRVEHVHGRLDLHTGDGSVRATGAGGQMTISTGDGSVTLDDMDGDLDVDTGDGSVHAAGTPGRLRVHTSDGSFTLRADAGTTMKDDWSITTGDGGVAIYLPPDFAAELDARAGDGSIRNDLRVTTEAGGEVGRHAVRGRLGAGGKTLRIRTGDGSVRLKVN